MDDILEMARRLGQAIAASPQATALRETRKGLRDQKDLDQVRKDYQAQAQKIGRLQAEKKPIEVADKHRLQELEEKLLASEVFKKFTAAQMEYVDLMRKVNESLRKELTPTEA